MGISFKTSYFLYRKGTDDDEILYVIEECPYKGDCPGICSRCEADLYYLTEAIDAKEKNGIFPSLYSGNLCMFSPKPLHVFQETSA